MPKIICTKDDWLKLGLLRFAEDGPGALNIEKMSSQLGCAKTSFYHYFKNRNNFLDQIIAYWVTYTTGKVSEELNAIDNPIEKIKFITQYLYTTKEMKNFYFYLRQLSKTKAAYRKLLNENENYRIDSFSRTLQELKIAKEDAEIIAEIYYDRFFGWYERNKHIPMTPSILKKQYKIVSKIIGVDITGEL